MQNIIYIRNGGFISTVGFPGLDTPRLGFHTVVGYPLRISNQNSTVALYWEMPKAVGGGRRLPAGAACMNLRLIALTLLSI